MFCGLCSTKSRVVGKFKLKEDKMNSWFLIYCKSKQEIRAEENLLRQGFDVFRPTINVARSKIGCQSVIRNEPLFPGYLFIKVDPDVKSIGPVNSTLGVSNFVRFGDNYAVASDILIDDIKLNVNRQNAIASDEYTLKNGDEIYVNGHGFDQAQAIYCNPCGFERAVILMNILGRQSKLMVPTKCLFKR